MTTQFRSLQRSEAEARRALLDLTAYDVSLDLRDQGETFSSRTRLTFHSGGGRTFLDLKPRTLHSVVLNGSSLDPSTLSDGRLPLDTAPGANELVVEATMGYRNDGEGLHLHTDPADGRRYVYGMSFMDAAPSIFACFDQPDLKAPYTLHVRAPHDWTVIGNAAATQVEPGVWELEESQPLSTYFVTLVAGPYHVITDEHDGIALGLSARQSIAHALDADAEELLAMTRACFDEFHRLFGVRYPFGKYHQAFVPEFNAGAMENPGCVTFRDQMVFTSKVTRGVRVQRATTVAHEMAHQWFGNLTTPRWWDDLWLNESFAEYMGNRVTADVTEFGDAWTHNAYARRQWGLSTDLSPSTHPVAGNGAVDATAALQDFDGISYVKGSSILKQLNARLGDDVFFRGVAAHFDRHRFGNATMADLLGAWEDAGAGDLSDFAATWLRTAGPDTLHWDRERAVVLRTPPPEHPADRSHTIRVATSSAGGDTWDLHRVAITGPETPFATEATAVVLDPFEDTWAATTVDRATVEDLRVLLPATPDARMRAGLWNSVRSTFHAGDLAPETALELVEAALPHEDNDDAVHYLLPWAINRVAALSDDPAAAERRIHRTMMSRVETAAAGSSLQLGAFQSAVATCPDPAVLRTWVAADLPEGLTLDADLRWALLVRLARLGDAEQDELDDELRREPTAKASVEHSRAMASRPSAAAKEWAWERFLGTADVSNYELEAAGLGLWRTGQEELTAPFATRYLDALRDLPQAHSGWVLGTAVRSFFPVTRLSSELVDRAQALAEADGLDPTVRRNLLDQTDDLRRRVAVRARWGRP